MVRATTGMRCLISVPSSVPRLLKISRLSKVNPATSSQCSGTTPSRSTSTASTTTVDPSPTSNAPSILPSMIARRLAGESSSSLMVSFSHSLAEAMPACNVPPIIRAITRIETAKYGM